MTEVRVIDPAPTEASAFHVGVTVAGWNRAITERLLEGAVTRLEELGVGKVTVLRVPGSLELPIGARGLADSGCDAVVALGVVVKGDTDHYATVVTESARGLTMVSHSQGIPVTNGILAVHDVELALERARPGASNKGYEAATAAVEALSALAALGAVEASR